MGVSRSYKNLVVVILAALLASCGGGGGSSSSGSGSSFDPSLDTVPQFGHVFLVVEEHQTYSDVIGNSLMPYINSLAQKYGLATNYFANSHPSIPNYFMLTAGKLITNDETFSGTVSDDNVVRELIKAKKTWKVYAESLPSVGFTGSRTPYGKDHNPFVFFTDVLNDPNQLNNIVPFSQFGPDLSAGALPNYTYILPNNVDNSRDCPVSQPDCSDDEKRSTSDQWLQANIDPLINSAAFKKDGLLIIVYDESDFSDGKHGGGHIPALLISSKVLTGKRSDTFYQHQNVLRTMLKALGISVFPGNSNSTNAMGDFFSGS
jgi:phosphatidylinositol-3-phosphatase